MAERKKLICMDRRFAIEKTALLRFKAGDLSGSITLWPMTHEYVDQHKENFEIIELGSILQIIKNPAEPG